MDITKNTILITIIGVLFTFILSISTTNAAEPNNDYTDYPELNSKQEIIKFCEDNIKNRTKSFTFKTKIKISDTKEFINHILYHEIFNNDRKNNMEDIYKYELFDSNKGAYTNPKNDNPRKIRIEPEYDLTIKKEKYCKEKTKIIAKKLKLKSKKINKYKKLKKINKYLIKRMGYKRKQWSLYTALKKKKGNCMAYASQVYMLCKEAGIECRIIGNKLHVWNIVKLNKKWYHIDTTWNDGLDDSSIFFLKGSKYMAKHGHRHLIDLYKTKAFKKYYKISKTNYKVKK